ncbi:major facilitator superfamily domain-containing protein [Bombardia bombarda]|uniref:Major facilitator superfamily domain-containing protein n=1 Tax=Bombardia bombarda TaxID=252184 RepID=A0AA40CFA8_9PEZI|nr:major facilitator superfamily domain-containing protein [Bombardia bombarda]
MGSALAANLTVYLQREFHVPSGPETILPTSVYLVGFVFGPMIFAPLSESHGRRPVLMVGFVLFTLATLGSALAPNWVSFLVFRFLTGAFGSPPLSVGGGVVADVFWRERERGRVMMVWSATTFIGPLGAPIISGFVPGPKGWRWVFWIALIWTVATFPAVFFLPETLASKILRTKAAKLNKETKGGGFMAPSDLHREPFWVSLKTTLSRPLRLLCTEMLLALTCVYLAFVYAVFYMMLKIFAVIFQGVYGFSPGVSGIAFTTMGLGTICACCVIVWYDGVAPRLSDRHPTKKPEYLRLPVACAGGPAFVVALLWLGWSARPEVHWVVPLLATIPYGFAYNMIFTSMINYVTDAYDIYAASALAACSMTRSIAGALIPLAIDDMLASLGIGWSCTVLALISAGLSFVPFGFIAFGEKIRSRSSFSAALEEDRAVDGGEMTRSLSAV